MLVHGYAEHVARYEYAGAVLSRAGYAVHGFDLRGHGRSEGRRALVRSQDEFLDDLDVFVARTRARYDAPLFILGHSMGGGIVALHGIERRPAVAGILLSGAATGAGRRRGISIMRYVVFLLAKIRPTFGITELDAGAISRDPEVVESYESDPLVYRGKMQAGILAAMMRAQQRIASGARALHLPMLIMHGTEDRLVPVEAGKRLYECVGSEDKTLRLYEGLYHEILNEPERDEVLGDIVAWLNARTLVLAR